VSLTIEVSHILPERIHLRLLNPNAYTIDRVIRVDVNGTRTLRTLDGQLPSAAAVLEIDDFEYALTGTITYTAYRNTGAAAATATVSMSPPMFPHAVLIAAPLYPPDGRTLADGSLDPNAITFAISWDATREARSTVHQVIGRPDPVAVLRPAALQAGSITLIGPDYLTVEQLAAQLSQARVWMLRQADVPGLDLYFVVTGLRLNNAEPLHWQLEVSFAEVAWPNGSYVAVTVWTYAEVAAGYGDYNAVASSFVDYLDLLEKRPIA